MGTTGRGDRQQPARPDAAETHPRRSPPTVPALEAQWTRLRKHVQWARGFWLVFVFAADAEQVATLHQRFADLLRGRAAGVRTLQPATPDELRASLSDVLDEESARAGHVWLQAVRTGPASLSPPLPVQASEGPDNEDRRPAAQPRAWEQAWVDLMLRMNERRSALERHLRGGLVLACPTAVKAEVRKAAPDLWSIRSLVLDLAPVQQQSPIPGEQPDGAAGELEPEHVPDADLALAQARRADRAGRPRDRAVALARAAEGLVAAGQPPRAVAAARDAVALLAEGSDPQDPAARADALAALARAELADGDPAAAMEHIQGALDLVPDEGRPDRDVLLWLDLWGRIALGAGRLDDAADAYERAVAAARRLADTLADTPQALRDLSVSLDMVGDVHHALGRHDDARTAYAEACDLMERVASGPATTEQVEAELATLRDKRDSIAQEDDRNLDGS